jgi:hypothetical protein
MGCQETASQAHPRGQFLGNRRSQAVNLKCMEFRAGDPGGMFGSIDWHFSVIATPVRSRIVTLGCKH